MSVDDQIARRRLIERAREWLAGDTDYSDIGQIAHRLGQAGAYIEMLIEELEGTDQ